MNNYHEIELPRASEVAMRLIRNTLWAHSSRRSIVSELWLREYANTPLFANCFMYVLPVKEYPYFRHYLKNIILLTPGERGLWLDGKEEERIQYALDIEDRTKGLQTARWDLIKTLEAELKIEYKQYFPTTRGMIVNYRYSLGEQQKIIGKLNKKFLESM